MAEDENERTSIELKKSTRDRLAIWCGKEYKGTTGQKSYDEGLNELLDFWKKNKDRHEAEGDGGKS
jgi:hypothetical protein